MRSRCLHIEGYFYFTKIFILHTNRLLSASCRFAVYIQPKSEMINKKSFRFQAVVR